MICCSLCFALVLAVAMVTCAPTVRVSRSSFKGVDLEADQTNKAYHAYYGIPFAEPPVDHLRFKAPVPYNNRKRRIFDDQTFRAACTQGNESLEITNSTEDCLYLNVFTPEAADGFNTTDSKQVLVYIHGGNFNTGGTSTFSPSNLVTDYDVIVVTTAYRLGPLGFLSSGDEALPGNLGLLDQITALQWVKDNIENFGGDANDVTVYGASSGAVSVSLLSLSPLGKGLFTKVILESGSPMAPWAIDKRSEDTFYSLALNSHCLPLGTDASTTPLEYHNQIVDCLRGEDAHQLELFLANETTLRPEDAISMEGVVFFGPIVDGVVIPRDPFKLLKDVDYLREVGALDRKYMVGLTNNEGLRFLIDTSEAVPREDLLYPDSPGAQAIIKNNFRSVHSCPVTEDILHVVSFLYFYPVNPHGESSIQSSVDFMSDVDFVVPAIKFVRALTEASNDVKVYLSLLDYYPEVPIPDFPIQGSVNGLPTVLLFDEGDEFLNMFPYFNIPAESLSILRKTYRDIVTNMAKNGNPSIPNSGRWAAYDRFNEHYMAISETPETRQHMYAKRVSMWEDFLPKVLGSDFTREF